MIPTPDPSPYDAEADVPAAVEDVAKPEQPPMDDDVNAVVEDEAAKLGDFA